MTDTSAIREALAEALVEPSCGYSLNGCTSSRALAEARRILANLPAAQEWEQRIRADERAKVYGVLGALEDNLTPPADGVLAEVTKLVAEPGPSNALTWAFVAVGDQAVNDWLASPDAEQRLAAAMHESGVNCLRPVAASRNVCLPDRNAGAFHQEDARAILAALRSQSRQQASGAGGRGAAMMPRTDQWDVAR